MISKLNNLHIEIECTEAIPIYEDEDKAQEYLYDRTIEGFIYLRDDDDTISHEVGKLWLYILDGNKAAVANDNVREWCEENSADMFQYIAPLYNREGYIKPQCEISLQNNNALVFHWLELYPKYRNKGYGEKIVRTILARYSEQVGAIIVHPHPLQYSVQASESKRWIKKMKFDDFEDIKEAAAYEKVTAFWKGLGFRKIPKSNSIYYYKG